MHILTVFMSSLWMAKNPEIGVFTSEYIQEGQSVSQRDTEGV